MRWAGHVAPIGETRDSYNTLVGYVKERDNLGDLLFKGLEYYDQYIRPAAGHSGRAV
jgi:hypothetical protein